MKIDVPYGKSGSMSAKISDNIKVSFLEANDVKIGDEDENIKKAISSPINSKSFKAFLSDAKSAYNCQ